MSTDTCHLMALMWMGFRYKLLNLNCNLSNVVFRVLTVLFSVCIKYCSIRSQISISLHFIAIFVDLCTNLLIKNKKNKNGWYNSDVCKCLLELLCSWSLWGKGALALVNGDQNQSCVLWCVCGVCVCVWVWVCMGVSVSVTVSVRCGWRGKAGIETK